MKNSEFSEYLTSSLKYQGIMNVMANSIELLLRFILKRLGTKPRGMLGNKISMFEAHKSYLADKHSGDFRELIRNLRKFNGYWIVTKHGMIVGGHKDLTFDLDGESHTFDKAKQEEISQEFTETMTALTEIWNSVQSS